MATGGWLNKMTSHCKVFCPLRFDFGNKVTSVIWFVVCGVQGIRYNSNFRFIYTCNFASEINPWEVEGSGPNEVHRKRWRHSWSLQSETRRSCSDDVTSFRPGVTPGPPPWRHFLSGTPAKVLYKLLTLMIWLIQPMNEEILTYTPGTSFRPQPKPHDTNPVNSKYPESSQTNGPPPSPWG